MTWKELKDKISLMTEEEQRQEVAVWGENMNLMKDCSLEKTVFDLSRDEIVALTDEEISLYIDKELAGKGIPIEAKNWNIKNEKEVVYPDCGVPIFVIKDIGVGFRKIEDATEVANLLVRSRAFKVNSKYLNRSYERLNVINEGVVPAVEGCVGYTNEEFERVNKENNDPESEKNRII